MKRYSEQELAEVRREYGDDVEVNVAGELRCPINISPQARRALRNFLMHEWEGTGKGYSAFILEAIETLRTRSSEGS
jgi:hypothetical protein